MQRVSGCAFGPARTHRERSCSQIKILGAETNMDKYQCNVCGWIYDPEKGDPTQNIEAGTPFEQLPDDWTCPECGAGKDEFTKL